MLDGDGEPVYVEMQPGFREHECHAPEKCDSHGQMTPFVLVKVNGRGTIVKISSAWKTGLTTIQYADRMSALQKMGALDAFGPDSETRIAVGFDDSPSTSFTLDDAREIGVSLMGAALSALHDMTMVTHMTTNLGMSVSEVEATFAGIESVDVLAYLENG